MVAVPGVMQVKLPVPLTVKEPVTVQVRAVPVASHRNMPFTVTFTMLFGLMLMVTVCVLPITTSSPASGMVPPQVELLFQSPEEAVVRTTAKEEKESRVTERHSMANFFLRRGF